MTTTVNFSYDRYNVRKRGEFDFEVRNERVSQVLLIPGLQTINLQRTLFGANEVGGIWDWSDRSTMFQDLAGTQPITASGQTRALHLDKSRGLVLGPEFNTNPGAPFTVTTGYGPAGSLFEFSIENGRLRSTYISGTPSTSHHVQRIQSGLVVGRTYRITVRLNRGTAERISMFTWGGLTKPDDFVNTSGDITRTYIITATDTQLVARFFPRTATEGAASTGVFFDLIELSVRELPGNHRFQPNLSNRPQYIEDETGHYGLYDGVDDFDQTNPINFTGTSRITTWWGGRKNSDAAAGLIFGQSPVAAAGFNLSHSIGSVASGQNYNMNMQRTIDTTGYSRRMSTFAAPISNVVTAIYDRSTNNFDPSMTARINGAQPTYTNASTISDNIGTFGTYAMVFGGRTSEWGNIREYMTIIRGAATPTNIIERVEREVRRKIRNLTW